MVKKIFILVEEKHFIQNNRNNLKVCITEDILALNIILIKSAWRIFKTKILDNILEKRFSFHYGCKKV